MWSYRRDLGRVRLLVIDSRCGRILDNDRRSMVGDEEFDWIERAVADGDYDHLVVGTSLPWLLPRALHEIESWDEALARSSRGRLVAGFGEWLRRALDLEHWAAFRASFDRLTKLFGRIGRGEHGVRPPASICVLSGDVHHTYTAVAAYPDQPESKVVQVTCSPFHNTIPLPMRIVFRFGWSSKMEFVMKARHPALRGAGPADPLAPPQRPRLRQRDRDAHPRRARTPACSSSGRSRRDGGGDDAPDDEAELKTLVELNLTEMRRVPA